MATLTLRDEARTLHDPTAITTFLAEHGIDYRNLPDPPRFAEDATPEAILAGFDPTIRALSEQGGYRSADVVAIHPGIPDLDAMLARFEREHTHDEDEVRLIVDGRGLFHVHPKDGPVFCIEVVAGDLIRVPRGTRHWFHVCGARRCRAVRLFQDAAGWTPHYTESRIEERYPPLWQERSGAPHG